jgi:large subunit ribosomal protein L4
MAGIIGSLELKGKRTLFVIADADGHVSLSARNIPRVKVSRASDLNTYDIVEADKLVVCEDALDKITETLSKN